MKEPKRSKAFIFLDLDLLLCLFTYIYILISLLVLSYLCLFVPFGLVMTQLAEAPRGGAAERIGSLVASAPRPAKDAEAPGRGATK